MTEVRPSRFQSWRTRTVAGAGGIAALLTSWGIGLFEVRTQPAPPGLRAGQSIAAGEWEVRLDSAQVGTLAPDGRALYGREALLIPAQLLNRTGRTSNSYNQAIKLVTAIPGIDRQPDAFLVRDRERLTQLHPGLPEQIVFMWTFPKGTHLPARLRFAIEARDFKPRDNLYAAAGWFNPHVLGTIDLPVTRAPTAQPQPGGVR